MNKNVAKILERAIETYGRYTPPPKEIKLKESGFSAEVKFKDGHPVFLTLEEISGAGSLVWKFNREQIKEILQI